VWWRQSFDRLGPRDKRPEGSEHTRRRHGDWQDASGLALGTSFPAAHPTPMPNFETAVFGGGCFWCLEAVFQRLPGIKSVESGYMGGHVENPTYKQVCTGTTGHAEVVRVTFDPGQISYRDLLDVFFAIHDPTTLNRQGNDVGTQYRSVIFYNSEEQRRLAEEMIADLGSAREFPDRIVTAVEPATKLFLAEGYHQNYFNENSEQPYCRFIIAPKLEKFRKTFAEKLKA
jgi:peptide-methionine (S)-S-oxide reductase